MAELTFITLQGAYDADQTSPQITAAVGFPISFEAGAAGAILTLRDTLPQVVYSFGDTDFLVGPAGSEGFEFSDLDSEKPALSFFPNGITVTASPPNAGFLQWIGTTFRTTFAGSSFGGVIQLTGTFEQEMSGFAFNNGLIFNHAITYQNASGFAADFGPIFSLVDQPLIRAQGSARTMSIQNSVRAQPRYGPHLTGGTLTVTNVTLYESAGSVAAGSTITTWRCFRAGGVGVGGGAIGTWIGLNIATPTVVAPSVVRGIQVEADFDDDGTRFFIAHLGTAPSFFAGQLRMLDAVDLRFGGDPGSAVHLSRSSAGVLRMINVGGTNNEGLDWDFDAGPDGIQVTSSTGAGFGINVQHLVLGTTVPDSTSNNQLLLAPGAKTATLGGDFARTLFSASANVTIDAALSTFATFTINEPAGVLGTGSVVDAANVIIQTSVAVGTNRYGLLITNNPSGGTLNYAFRQRNASARARFDGRLDINRGIALGGGAVATLGTIGGSGPTAAAQAQWVEIDVGTVPHWVAVWT